MKTTFAVILCVLLLLFSACAQKVNDPADVQAIKNMVAEWEKQSNARSLPEYSSIYYTGDAVRLQPNGSPLEGIEAIRKYAQADLDRNTSIKETDSVASVLSSGDLAVARGTWTWTATPTASGLSAVNDQGKWVGAFRRQSDGTWKCVYDMWNSDQPVSGATPSGVEEEALFQLERDWAAANLKKDMAALDKMLATEFQANYVGLVGNKKQFLSVLKSETSWTELMVSDMKALVFGDTAIVHGLSIVKSSKAGKDTSSQERFTDVFVKREGRWQCVTGYSTKVQ
jgi:ketosteroid isomerase-like protein